MSILQEYESIRRRLKPGEFDAIERYLEKNSDLFLSDIYYKEEEYKKFFIWWQNESEQKVKEQKTISTEENVQVYVDGSYNKEKNLTGAGVVIILGDHVYKKSFVVKTEEVHSWNIDGECHATLEALRICSGETTIEDITILAKNITINYDYNGIEKWATKEWKAKSEISKLYTKRFDTLVNKYDINISFNKIKAHTGDKYNEIADDLAYSATQGL